jgi:ATPase subunit of ABC transporter with duplicated ATPase domains
MCVSSFFIGSLSLSFPHKVCFSDFSARVYLGSRIAIIGRNGCGKSSLLRMISEMRACQSAGYVTQIITNYDSCSGGERFNKALSAALSGNPDILLLDEPTNHLDNNNRRGLFKKLDSYNGTLIVVTHDHEVLRRYADILWHISDGAVTIFNGKYDDYISEQIAQRESLYAQIKDLKKQKQTFHDDLVREQKRAAKSKAAGEKKVKDKRLMKSIGDLKGMKAEVSHGGKLKKIDQKKEALLEQLDQNRLPEIITPKFNIPFQKSYQSTVLAISDASVGYADKIVWRNINLSVSSSERVGIIGRNGCGKTTLINAILNNPAVIKTGDWNIPQPKDIGVLDQHYGTLATEDTPIDVISKAAPYWEYSEIRRHLNDFLFRKNEEVNEKVKNLSGGERARLSLAQIAAAPPKLLILDEITNNLDLETYDHVVQILSEYTGAMLVISHDESFLLNIKIDKLLEYSES